MKRLAIATASAGLVALSVSAVVGDAATTRKSELRIKLVRGANLAVPPLTVTGLDAYNVRCPVGFRATGYGVLNGANEVVYADPATDGRGYEFSFSNDSETSTFNSSASVICAAGRKGLRVGAAVARSARKKAVQDARARLAERR